MYQAVSNMKIETEIHQRNYAGDDGPMLLSGDPVHPRFGKDGDKYMTIKGSEVVINIQVTQADDYSWLYTNDDRELMVIIKVQNILWWSGFVLTDQYMEEQRPMRVLSITASDQLGLLDQRPFTFGSPAVSPSGYATILSILAKILSTAATTKTGLTLNIVDCCNLFEITMDHADTDDPLNQAKANQDLWVNANGTPASCKQVIDDIFTPLQCRLIQSVGKWYIERIPEMGGTSIDYREFDSTGAYVGNLSMNPQMSTAVKLATGTIEFTSGWKDRTLEVDYGLKPSLIPNFNFPDSAFTQDDPAIITGWTNDGTWKRQLVTSGNILMAETVSYLTARTEIVTDDFDISTAFKYVFNVKCGRMQHSLLPIYCDVVVSMWNGMDPGSRRYYNDIDNTWDVALITLTKINFPSITSFNQLTEQSLQIEAPPYNGQMSISFVSPYRGSLTSIDGTFYFGSVQVTGSLADDSEMINDLTFVDTISDNTNFTPPALSIVLSDGLEDDTLIPNYRGFIMVDAIGSRTWELKSLFGTGTDRALVNHLYSQWGCIFDSWWWQYSTPNKKYNGSFRGWLNPHQTVVVDGVTYLINDIDINLKRGEFSGTLIEIKDEQPSDGSGTLSLLLRNSKGTIYGFNGSGLIPQPGGIDGQLQFKSGGDFSGTTDVTFDGTRILKGGTLPLIEYRSGSESIASGEQQITFAEPFIAGDDYAILPIWGLDAEGNKMDGIPYSKDENGFKINFSVAVTFDYLAIIKR